MKPVFLFTPPFTQLNTPYPATAYLKGFLNTKGIPSAQTDLGLDVILTLFSKIGLERMFNRVAADSLKTCSINSQRIYKLKADYIGTIEAVISFLQGKNPTLALQICQEDFLPEASRFSQLEDLEWAFGSMGTQDKAKHLATLYLEDISDFIVECIDPNFGFSRYAERLGRSANTFDELYNTLQTKLSFIDELTLEELEKHLRRIEPDVVLISVPFPGNLFSAFRCAQYLKNQHPHLKIAMGGGFPNTELREVSDPRVFEFIDFITLDDGERPIESLLTYIQEGSGVLKRTFRLSDGRVVYQNDDSAPDYKQSETGTPDYSDLPLKNYISVIEVVNPMHRMWSDGRWNKLTMAHGCYWGKCTFCDISLDYIKNYSPVAAQLLCDRMEELIAQTGQSGFHFVDEAAPPALMRELALEILRRKLSVTWWTNIRFEKSFSEDLCRLLKESGCIAVSGGLEVASDRLLKLIDKGATVAQVANVTRHFTQAGIMVHAYLMYGYPTQTVQETVDSLEMVRQLFEAGVIQSGFWHQFALTAHSPIGLNPQSYGLKIEIPERLDFANNDIRFSDTTGIDHERFSYGLKKSLFNFMHGIGLDFPLQEWFDFKIPRTTIAPNFIENSRVEDRMTLPKPNAKLIWLREMPEMQKVEVKKKGRSFEQIQFQIHTKTDFSTVKFEVEQGEWVYKLLQRIQLSGGNMETFSLVIQDFDASGLDHFELFWFSKPWNQLRDLGLLVL